MSKGFDVAADSNASRILSLQYYNRTIHALQDLVVRKAGKSVPVVLFCSLIFIGIEMLQAANVIAIHQLQHSLRVFYDWARDINSLQSYSRLSESEQVIHNFFAFLGMHYNVNEYPRNKFLDSIEAQLRMYSDANVSERFRIRLELLQDEIVSFFLRYTKYRYSTYTRF